MTNPDKFSSDQQEYLKDIIINTLTTVDLDEAIKSITMELGKLFDADRVHFRFYEESMNTFSGVIEEYRKNETIPSAKGKMVYPKEFDTFLKDKLEVDKYLFIIDDINKPEYPESFKELFRSLEINNEIVLPIFFRNQLESAFFIANTESSELLSKKNLDFLIPIAKQISLGTHLFKINENLNKTANNEKILRDTIFKVRLFDNPEDVFEHTINSLAELYRVNRVVNLHIEPSGDFLVLNEALRGTNSALKGTIMFKPEAFKLITTTKEDSIIVIDDVNQVEDEDLQNYFIKNDILAFMLYPIAELLPIKGERKVEERIMVCSDIPRKWSPEDIEALTLIIGTISVIYVDIRNRKESREIEETFIASMVHDLKSPIYAEQKALEYIMSRKPDTTIQKITSYLSDMYNTNEEILRLISNLLTVYSMDVGKLELKKEPVNINKIIENAVRTIKPLADDNESKINVNIQENVEDIYMDPDEIRRAITNLLSNAIKHNLKGVKINISVEMKQDEILISISDNGVGISEADKANMFQKYRTTKRKVGSGLGLYLSQQIVEHHGGKLWFESEEGKGTTFYFTLPLSIEL